MKTEYLNRVQLRGTVGRCVLNSYGDRLFAKMSVATNSCHKDGQGNIVLETVWHSVRAFAGERIPETTLRSIGKGSAVEIDGRIVTRRYTAADGSDRVATEVVAQRVDILRIDVLKYENRQD